MLEIAYSPCPNDTILFHAWVHGLLDAPAPTPHLADIQELNRLALDKRFPLCKVSFHCLGHILDDYALLPVGAALGYGVGPLLVAREPFDLADLHKKRVAIPGKETTAHLLLSILAPNPLEKHFCLYHETTHLLESDQVDAAVIIHEQRFTFEAQGFTLIADLGTHYENRFSAAIPLGGLAIRRDYAHDLTPTLLDSLDYARAHPEASLPYILEHAQEKDSEVVRKHIETYVTAETRTLTPDGERAIDTLFREARSRNLLPQGPDWRCS